MKVLFLAFLLAAGSDLRDEIEEERAAHDEELQSDQFASPLTAAGQVMIEPGNWTTLTLCEDGVRFGSAAGCQPLVELEFTATNRLMRGTK